MHAVTESHSVLQGRDLKRWMPALWVGVMLAVAFFPVLKGLVREWQTNEDMAHGFFVPLLAGFVAWERRRDLFSNHVDSQRTYPQGLILMLWGSIQLCIGMLGAELFLQ